MAGPAMAKSASKSKRPVKTKVKAIQTTSKNEIQSQIEDYREQLQLIDEKELMDEDFDRAFFDRIRSTYDREIRRLEQMKKMKS